MGRIGKITPEQLRSARRLLRELPVKDICCSREEAVAFLEKDPKGAFRKGYTPKELCALSKKAGIITERLIASYQEPPKGDVKTEIKSSRSRVAVTREAVFFLPRKRRTAMWQKMPLLHGRIRRHPHQNLNRFGMRLSRLSKTHSLVREVRRKRDKAKERLANDIDPGAQKKATKEEAEAPAREQARTFAVVAQEWFAPKQDFYAATNIKKKF